jgi:hypothetical protein
MNRNETTREATELNATQGDDSMNRNETTCELTEEATSKESPLVFLNLVMSVAEARMGSPTGKVHAPGLAKRHGVPGSFVKDMAAALKPISKADTMEFIALLDAGISGRCCYQEMVAAMLEVFGAKYRLHARTVWLLGLLVRWALSDLGVPDDGMAGGLAYHVASGGDRSKATIAQLVGEDDALYALRSRDTTEMLARPQTLACLSTPTLVLRRASRHATTRCLTGAAESAIARIAGLVVKAKQGHHPTAHAIPQALCVTEGAGLSGADAEYCTSLGCEVGEDLAWFIRCCIDRMASVSPWFFGICRARTAAEMMRDAAATVAAA